MKWITYQIIMRNAKARRFDNATGTGSDESTDPNPLTDPNDYLAPRIDKINVIQILVIIALAVAVVYLSAITLKQLKPIA